MSIAMDPLCTGVNTKDTQAIRHERMGHIITGSHKRTPWQVVVHCEVFG